MFNEKGLLYSVKIPQAKPPIVLRGGNIVPVDKVQPFVLISRGPNEGPNLAFNFILDPFGNMIGSQEVGGDSLEDRLTQCEFTSPREILSDPGLSAFNNFLNQV